MYYNYIKNDLFKYYVIFTTIYKCSMYLHMFIYGVNLYAYDIHFT